MTNTNKAKTVVLAALAFIVLVPAGAAYSTQPSHESVAPPHLEGTVEIGEVTVTSFSPFETSSAGPLRQVAPAVKALPQAKGNAGRAVRVATCRSHVLEQGGLPNARTVLAWTDETACH